MNYKLIESNDGTKRIDFLEGYSCVIIPTKNNKNTFCVSCQIGCPVKCKFCYSGKKNFKRNLEKEEIINQVEIACKLIGKNPTAIVFMGVGEPLLNIKNVLDAAEEIHKMFLVAYHRITISTSGLKNIDDLLNIKFNVAISLHSPFDKKRKELIPLSISIKKIINFSNEYCIIHHKKNYIMVEYSLIKGINDSERDLIKLMSLNWPKRTLFNLIEFNEMGNFKKSEEEKYKQFKLEIIKKGFKCFIRKSRGQDISASCGMLE